MEDRFYWSDFALADMLSGRDRSSSSGVCVWLCRALDRSDFGRPSMLYALLRPPTTIPGGSPAFETVSVSTFLQSVLYLPSCNRSDWPICHAVSSVPRSHVVGFRIETSGLLSLRAFAASTGRLNDLNVCKSSTKTSLAFCYGMLLTFDCSRSPKPFQHRFSSSTVIVQIHSLTH